MGNVEGAVWGTLNTLSYGVCGAPSSVDTQEDEIKKETMHYRQQKQRQQKHTNHVNNMSYRQYPSNNNHDQHGITTNNNMNNTNYESLSIKNNVSTSHKKKRIRSNYNAMNTIDVPPKQTYYDDYQITAKRTNYKSVEWNEYNIGDNDKQQSFDDLKETFNELKERMDYVQQINDKKERDEKQDDYKYKNKNIGVCKATQNYLVKHKLCYIERDEALTDEHFKMFNALRIYVDSILSKKIEWKLSVLQPKLLDFIDIDNKQKRKYGEYATSEMYDYLSSYATEQRLIAALTGSDYRLETAKITILKTIQWRVCSKVDNISPAMFERSIKTKIIYSLNKRDKKGHLICYVKVTETLPKDPWDIARAAIWTIEKSIKMAEKYGVYQTIWLLDLEHLKYTTVPPIEVIKEIANLLQCYYPERLYRAYILFSPWVFRMIWKMISPLLTENTKSKIIVPKWSQCNQYQTFQKYIDKANLDKKFGGDLEPKYSYKWEMHQYTKTNNYTQL